jgi:hypothetical protein
MANYDYIHPAIQELYPGANPTSDYIWATGDDGNPYMAYWDAAKLGELYMAEVDAKCDELAAKGPYVAEIGRRQFFQGFAQRSLITEQEARDAMAIGKIPTTMQTLVDSLPQDEQFAAEMAIIGNIVFHQDHPLTQQLAVAYGWTPDQLQEFWYFASTL